MSDFQYNEELSATMGLVKRQSAELDRLRAEVASLKELNKLDKEVHSKMPELVGEIAHLTQQLAAANGRVERMREALEIAYDHLLVHWTEEQLKTVVPLHKIPAALSDLPYEVPSFDERSSEADKEKS